MVGLIGLFAVALVLSYLSVNGMRYFAEHHQILDVPNERSSHTVSVPRGAGLVIVVVTLLGVWLYVWWNPVVARSSLLAFTVGAVLIAAVSWLDDLRSQPNWVRFAIHSVGALLAIYGFGYIPVSSILNADQSGFGWLGFIITFFWIVGLTNAYNFMDGIDGIAGGQAVVAGLGGAALGWLTEQPLMIVFGLLIAASSLGFLFHNWPPASIFMGDVGSAFLGYSFAVLPLIFNSRVDQRRGLGSMLAAMLLVWPFVFDTILTFLRRLRLGENVFSAHRSHLYQRLVIVGYTHQFVSLLYSGMALLGSVFAVALILRWRNAPVAVAVVLPVIWLTLWTFVTRQEHRRATRLRSRVPTYDDPV